MKLTTPKYRQLLSILRDSERKPLPTIAKEVFALSWRAKRPASFYFTGLLYKRGMDLEHHLTIPVMRRIQEVLSDRIAVDILHNKLFINEFFGARGIPIPLLLAYNFGNRLYTHQSNQWREFNLDNDECVVEIESLFARTESPALFVKPLKQSGGGRSRKLYAEDVATREGLKKLRSYLLRGAFLIQEEVMQHPQLKTLNPSSLNTIRIDTFRSDGGNAEVISALLRIGMAGSHIDNIVAGGMYVGIDIANGRLKERAQNKLAKGAGGFAAHPDSGVVFKDYELPQFERVIRLAEEAANLLPPALIGWDIALSTQGPVLVEGNARYYDMGLSDIAYGGYRRNPTFRKVIDAAKRQGISI